MRVSKSQRSLAVVIAVLLASVLLPLRVAAAEAGWENEGVWQWTNRRARIRGLSVGPTGRIDRILLEDGSTLSIPAEAKVQSSELKPGLLVQFQGVSRKAEMSAAWPDAKFIEPVDLKKQDGKSLLHAEGGREAGRWEDTDGVITRFLKTPDGRIDGLVLNNRKALKFVPLEKSQTASWKNGVRVRASGVANGGKIGVRLLVIGSDALQVLWPKNVLLAEKQEQQAGQAAEAQASFPIPKPTATDSRVQAILRGTGGEISSVLLQNGITVQIDPARLGNVPYDLRLGEAVRVRGCTLAAGAKDFIEVESIVRFARP